MPEDTTPAGAGVCLVTTRVPCRLIIRPTTPGRGIAWPMLVADPCPFSFGNPWEIPRPHAHVHFITEPGPPWYRVAPCNRAPYCLEIEAAG